MTRRAAVAIVAFTLVASLGTVRTAERRWTPDALMPVKRIAAVVPSPDASCVAFVVSEAVMEGETSEWLSQIVYPRQPPGFTEPKMTKDAMERNHDWFDRCVLGGAKAGSN